MKRLCVASTAALALLAGCGGGTEPEALRIPNIAGRYEGSWGLIAQDTVEACGEGGEGSGTCEFGVIEVLACHAVVDITQQGDQFVGTYAVDSAGRLACQGHEYLTGKRPAMTGEISNGVIDSLFGRFKEPVEPVLAMRMHFAFGQGGPEEFERLVGCTLVDRSTPWAVDASWAEESVAGGPPRGNILSARSHGSSLRTKVRVECRGRRMDIEIQLDVSTNAGGFWNSPSIPRAPHVW
jgi:hypothetical protein